MQTSNSKYQQNREPSESPVKKRKLTKLFEGQAKISTRTAQSLSKYCSIHSFTTSICCIFFKISFFPYHLFDVTLCRLVFSAFCTTDHLASSVCHESCGSLF